MLLEHPTGDHQRMSVCGVKLPASSYVVSCIMQWRARNKVWRCTKQRSSLCDPTLVHDLPCGGDMSMLKNKNRELHDLAKLTKSKVHGFCFRLKQNDGNDVGPLKRQKCE